MWFDPTLTETILFALSDKVRLALLPFGAMAKLWIAIHRTRLV